MVLKERWECFFHGWEKDVVLKEMYIRVGFFKGRVCMESLPAGGARFGFKTYFTFVG